MPLNVEWKARVRDADRQRQLIGRLADGAPELLHQVDTFFPVPHGYLKLRQFSPDHGELIHYLRPTQAQPKLSNYVLFPTTQPEILRVLLTRALGVRGEVRKRRLVYRAGQNRIHWDQVEQLGTFIEVEVVLQSGQSAAEGEQIAQELRRHVEVTDEDLIDVPYVELLGRG